MTLNAWRTTQLFAIPLNLYVVSTLASSTLNAAMSIISCFLRDAVVVPRRIVRCFQWYFDLLGRSLWRVLRRTFLTGSASGDLHTIHLSTNRVSGNAFA